MVLCVWMFGNCTMQRKTVQKKPSVSKMHRWRSNSYNSIWFLQRVGHGGIRPQKKYKGGSKETAQTKLLRFPAKKRERGKKVCYLTVPLTNETHFFAVSKLFFSSTGFKGEIQHQKSHSLFGRKRCNICLFADAFLGPPLRLFSMSNLCYSKYLPVK